MTAACQGSSVHRILQARRLESVAISFFRGSSQPRSWTGVSCVAGGLFTSFNSWVGKIPWRRNRLLTPVFSAGGSAGKESTCNAGDLGSIPGFNPWIRKILWRREELLTPVFQPGEFHRLYIPWGRKDSNTAEFHFHFSLPAELHRSPNRSSALANLFTNHILNYLALCSHSHPDCKTTVFLLCLYKLHSLFILQMFTR